MKTDKKENSDYPVNNLNTPIQRSDQDKVLGGVCGGFGNYFNLDPNIFRLFFILISIFGGSGILIYLLLWVILPSEIDNISNRDHLSQVKNRFHRFAEDIKQSTGISHSEGNINKSWIAIIVILLGLVFMLNNLGLGNFINFDKLWPILLIMIGLKILWRK